MRLSFDVAADYACAMASEEQGVHPAAVRLVWKVVGVVGVPISVAALLLWRDAALTSERLDHLSRSQAATAAALEAHLDSERARLTSQAAADRDAAVAQARLEAALAAVRSTLDAILQALPRRR